VSRIGFYGRGTQRRKIPFVCCAGVSPVREREEGRGEVLEPSPQPSPIRMGEGGGKRKRSRRGGRKRRNLGALTPALSHQTPQHGRGRKRRGDGG